MRNSTLQPGTCVEPEGKSSKCRTTIWNVNRSSVIAAIVGPLLKLPPSGDYSPRFLQGRNSWIQHTALNSVLRCGFENRSPASTSASIPAMTRRKKKSTKEWTWISREFYAGVGGRDSSRQLICLQGVRHWNSLNLNKRLIRSSWIAAVSDIKGIACLQIR